MGVQRSPRDPSQSCKPSFNGLPLRKAAFACMDTILDTLLERVDIPAFLPYLCLGLKDHEDVAMLSHQILAKVCAVQPSMKEGSHAKQARRWIGSERAERNQKRRFLVQDEQTDDGL